MEEPDPKLRQALAQAADLYKRKDYLKAKNALHELKLTHLSIELNALICDYKAHPQQLPTILRKIMDILVAVNIKLYQERPSKGKKTPKITHEFYFWNIIVLSQLLPNPEITELIANQALHFIDSLRTETSLMILSQMLNRMQSRSRVASCIALLEKQNRIMVYAKNLSKEEQGYRFMNQIVFCKILLKLGMIEGSRIMFMMKFNQNIEDNKDDELTQLSGLSIAIHQELLHAQIQYHAQNYPQAIKILSDLLPKIDTIPAQREYLRHIIDHNIGLVLANIKQTAPSQLLIHKTIQHLRQTKQLEMNNEKAAIITKCKDNMLLAMLMEPKSSYENGYESLKGQQNSYSYKINYRKAQLCLNYYHELIKGSSKVLPYADINDFYQTLYYYPNMPYFQQKGKNKNPNYTNKKFVYRRYQISDSHKSAPPKDINPDKKDQPKDKKGQNKGKKVIKKEEETVASKVKEVLNLCQWYLREALIILEKEKNIIVNLEDEEKGLTAQVNQKLYSEYITFKSSIYCLLCYAHLCKEQWHLTIYYASLFQAFQKQYQFKGKNAAQHQNYYNVLTYQMEAYSHIDRMKKSYDLLHDLLTSVDYNDSTPIQSRSDSNFNTIFETSTQYNNFAYNLSVLYSRDNKIPEAYSYIQKLLQQVREIPTNPKARLPLSLVELLIHYNLRTSNQSSALQLLKRRRILNLPGVIGHYHPTLNITK